MDKKKCFGRKLKIYQLNFLHSQLKDNYFEIEYFKRNGVIKKILNPFAFIILIFETKFKDVTLNIKLYNALKNNEYFDIGFYLNNNSDLIGSKWVKYFSPELHYVCFGFDENRPVNDKISNIKSKKVLLEKLVL